MSVPPAVIGSHPCTCSALFVSTMELHRQVHALRTDDHSARSRHPACPVGYPLFPLLRFSSILDGYLAQLPDRLFGSNAPIYILLNINGVTKLKTEPSLDSVKLFLNFTY